MKTSPIRIHEADKERLRKLARDLALAKGHPVSQQEALSRAMAFVLERREDFLTESTWKPLSDSQIRAWEDAISKTKGWKGIPPADIDDFVYGD